jgi:hypothetical protein
MRILHFVTGGFSGTQVAVDLSLAALRTPGHEVLLVLRRKPSTDERKIEALRQQGLQVIVVSNWLHALTVWELRKIIRGSSPMRCSPMVSATISGAARCGGRRRGAYLSCGTQLARALHAASSAPGPGAGAVHPGPYRRLRRRQDQPGRAGFPAEKCIAICNGIDLTRFAQEAMPQLWQEREPAIYMASRFARQKITTR